MRPASFLPIFTFAIVFIASLEARKLDKRGKYIKTSAVVDIDTRVGETAKVAAKIGAAQEAADNLVTGVAAGKYTGVDGTADIGGTVSGTVGSVGGFSDLYGVRNAVSGVHGYGSLSGLKSGGTRKYAGSRGGNTALHGKSRVNGLMPGDLTASDLASIRGGYKHSGRRGGNATSDNKTRGSVTNAVKVRLGSPFKGGSGANGKRRGKAAFNRYNRSKSNPGAKDIKVNVNDPSSADDALINAGKLYTAGDGVVNHVGASDSAADKYTGVGGLLAGGSDFGAVGGGDMYTGKGDGKAGLGTYKSIVGLVPGANPASEFASIRGAGAGS